MLNNRKPGRKSNAALLYKTICVLLIIGLMILGISVFTVANNIEVIGVRKYTEKQVIEASGFNTGDNLLFLDIENAELRIQTILPHISEVKISAKFPDTIRIEVVESTPIATVRYRNGILVIDSAVRVVEVYTNENNVPRGLIEIRGFTPMSAVMGSKLKAELTGESQLRYLGDILTAIEIEGLDNNISYIDISNITNITFNYTDRFRVVLDSPSNIAVNLSILKDTIADAERGGRIEPGQRGTLTFSDSRGQVTFNPDN